MTLDYAVSADARERFLASMSELGRRRRRDGAFAWGVYEDTEKAGHFTESFNVQSWLEHLRQHERVTADDKALQQQIQECLEEGARPRVRHFVAPNSLNTSTDKETADGQEETPSPDA